MPSVMFVCLPVEELTKLWSDAGEVFLDWWILGQCRRALGVVDRVRDSRSRFLIHNTRLSVGCCFVLGICP